MEFLEFLKLFFKGAVVDASTEKLEFKASLINDQFLTIILSDRLGIPNPLYYHTVELLPYFAENISRWEREIADRERFFSKLAGEFGEP